MRLARRLIPALAIALASCTEATGVANADILGRWNLSTVDGRPLPFAVDESATQRVEIVADDLTLNENGSLTGSTSLRLIENGQVVSTESFQQTGTWTRTGSSLSMRITEDGETFDSSATVGDGTLTVNGGGNVFIYRR
jgi:hypothetical protein